MKKSVLNQALTKPLRNQYIAVGGAYRFKNFQAWLLTTDLPTDLHAFLALFAFDGARLKDFNSIIGSHPTLYDSGKVGISWHDHIGRTQRLRLSPMTISLLGETNWKNIQNYKIEDLAEVYGKFAGNSKALDHFTADQLAWFSEIGTGPLIEHFMGRIPMTALSNECYVRKNTKLVVATENSDSDNDEEAERILSIALLGFLEPSGKDNNPIIIDRLLQICHRKRIDDSTKHKQSMLAQCLNLAKEAVEYGPASSLILAWACDLIGQGTSNKTNISVSTIVNYVGVLARPIFGAIRHQEINDWDAQKFEELYDQILREISTGQKRNMASAISSWHQFLVNWLDTPPITKKLHDQVSEAPPQANILWAHEYNLIQEWLTNAQCDERVILYLQAMFCVAYKIRIRIGELLKLKISDINIFDSKVEISIRGTKSKAAKRRIEVESFEVIELIKLIQRRQNESALPDDLLFADPNRLDKVFELSKLYTYSNQLLKVATGDRTIRFHSLSHTVISLTISQILAGGTTALLNPMHQSATDVAHFSVLTSTHEYVHLYEDAIRETINRGLQDLVITSQTASKWSRDTPEAIRKRVSRGGIVKNHMYWQIIFGSSHISRIDAIEDAYKTEKPKKPQFLSEINMPDYIKILNVFGDFSTNTPIETIALRQSIKTEQIKNLLTYAKSVIFKGNLHQDINFDSSINKVAFTIGKLGGVDFIKTQKPKLNRITKLFQRYYLTNDILDGAKAWLILQKSKYIAISSDTDSRNLVLALSKIELPVTQLAVAYSENANPSALPIIQSFFYEAYGATVPQFKVKNRRGRPNTYLLISSTRVQSAVMPKPATTSVSGLNALFFISMVILEGQFTDGK